MLPLTASISPVTVAGTVVLADIVPVIGKAGDQVGPDNQTFPGANDILGENVYACGAGPVEVAPSPVIV